MAIRIPRELSFAELRQRSCDVRRQARETQRRSAGQRGAAAQLVAEARARQDRAQLVATDLVLS